MNCLTISITKTELEASKFCGMLIEGELHEVCAIQMAVREIYPEAIVLKDRIFIDDEAEAADVFIPLPANAVAFIKAFDAASPEERVMMDELAFEIHETRVESEELIAEEVW